MLVLCEDPELIATEQQRQEAVRRVGEYAMSLVSDGTLKGGSPLQPVTEAKQVRIRNGQQRILDGPFAEAKEVIAGYFIVEASSVEAATAIAARCPSAEFGSVEVREIAPMG
jgi:hypothetical protein